MMELLNNTIPFLPLTLVGLGLLCYKNGRDTGIRNSGMVHTVATGFSGPQIVCKIACLLIIICEDTTAAVLTPMHSGGVC